MQSLLPIITFSHMGLTLAPQMGASQVGMTLGYGHFPDWDSGTQRVKHVAQVLDVSNVRVRICILGKPQSPGLIMDMWRLLS